MMPQRPKELMESLVATGQYQLSNFDADILDLFAAAYADEAETAAEIKRVYEASDYIEDPHTAVASAVYQKYRSQTGDTAKTVIASTASPYKFPRCGSRSGDRRDRSRRFRSLG